MTTKAMKIMINSKTNMTKKTENKKMKTNKAVKIKEKEIKIVKNIFFGGIY